MRHKRRCFTMPDPLYDRLTREATRKQLSISETLRLILENALPPQYDAVAAAMKGASNNGQEG